MFSKMLKMMLDLTLVRKEPTWQNYLTGNSTQNKNKVFSFEFLKGKLNLFS